MVDTFSWGDTLGNGLTQIFSWASGNDTVGNALETAFNYAAAPAAGLIDFGRGLLSELAPGLSGETNQIISTVATWAIAGTIAQRTNGWVGAALFASTVAGTLQANDGAYLDRVWQPSAERVYRDSHGMTPN